MLFVVLGYLNGSKGVGILVISGIGKFDESKGTGGVTLCELAKVSSAEESKVFSI